MIAGSVGSNAFRLQSTPYTYESTSLHLAFIMASELAAEMPSFMGRRRASRAEPTGAENRQAKQARVVQQAEDAAANSGGGRASKQNILVQLVMILTRMSMNQARELAELTGVMFTCFLLPLSHVLAVLTMDGGDEYQEMVVERRQAVADLEQRKPKAKQKSKKEDQISDDDMSGKEEPPSDQETVPLLPSPHLFISLKAIGGLIEKGNKDETPEALSVRHKLKQAWDNQVKGKEESVIMGVIKIWRGRRPQKGKGPKPKHLKLIMCLADPLQEHLSAYLKLTGATQKQGQAPRGYLEREAANLLKKLNSK